MRIVEPISESPELSGGIVIAAGYLNGSQRYQNVFLDMVNALILRRAFTEQADQLTGDRHK